MGKGSVVRVAGDVEGAPHPSMTLSVVVVSAWPQCAAAACKMASSPLLFVQHQLALCLLHGVFVVCFLRSQ